MNELLKFLTKEMPLCTRSHALILLRTLWWFSFLILASSVLSVGLLHEHIVISLNKTSCLYYFSQLLPSFLSFIAKLLKIWLRAFTAILSSLLDWTYSTQISHLITLKNACGVHQCSPNWLNPMHLFGYLDVLTMIQN